MADGAWYHDWCAVHECFFVVGSIKEGMCEDPWTCDDLSEDNDCDGWIFDSVKGVVIVFPTESRGGVFVREGGHGWVDQGD